MTASRWCPSCGDEYEPRILSCLDCGVALVDHQPEVLDPVVADEGEQLPGPAPRFDIGDLSADERRHLLAGLDEGSIPYFVVDDDTLEAVPGYEAELRDLVVGSISTWRQRFRSPLELEHRPLSLQRRTISVLVDVALAIGLTLMAVRLIDDGGVAAVVILSLLFLNQAYGVAERGGSVGKRLVGASLRSIHNDRLTLGEATARWLLRDTLPILAIAIEMSIDRPGGVWIVLELAAICYAIGLVSSVVVDSQGRGIHDHLVESVVVRASLDV